MKSVSFITGISSIAGISAILSSLMICGTGWIAGSQMLNLGRKLTTYGYPHPTKFSDCTSKYDTKYCTEYCESYKYIDQIWKQNQPVLITSCSMAIIVGFLQLAISFTISFSDFQNTKNRAKFWLTSHFVFFFILLLCILSVFITRLHYDIDIESWNHRIDEFLGILKNMDSSKDFGHLRSILILGTPLFYGLVGTNFVGLFVLFCLGIVFMHKYNKYESPA